MVPIVKFLVVLVFLLSLMGLVTYAQPVDTLQAFRTAPKEALSDLTLKSLRKKYDEEKDSGVKAKMAFALGVFSYKMGDRTRAGEYFNGAIQLKTHLDDYAHYYLGLIERDNKDYNGARKHFETVRNHQPPSLREADAEIELAQMFKMQNKWRDAYDVLAHMQKRHRGDPAYNDFLFSFVEAALNRKKGSEACKAAIRIYSKAPTFALNKGWGFDLNKVKFGNFALRCNPTSKDRDQRMQRLLVAGEFDELKSELKDWQTLIRADGKPHPDEAGRVEMLYGQLSSIDGKIKDAIGHFQTAQDLMGRNFDAQMFLARAYSQTDDYAASVEGYMKAFELSPKSKTGQKALFQAAFLSYTNKDYDGAQRRFEDVVKRTKGSIAWDARWHLAWIRYLKADYDGALKEFTELAKNKKFAKTPDQEKLQYWSAMAQLRNGDPEGARGLFTQLAAHKRLGYYTYAAVARLAALPVPSPTPIQPQLLAAPPAGPSIMAPPASASASPAAQATASPSPSSGLGGVAAGGDRSPASADEGLGGEKDALKDVSPSSDEEKDDKDEVEIVDEREEKPELPLITALKNPSLVSRFERAQDLIDLGFESWAVLELREIERRTSNHGYLQSLMGEYLKAGDYYRSAFIADVVFESQREKSGADGAPQLWSYAFPQAFDRFVNFSARRFDVSNDLVWAVMRGESGFREDVHSSAGAMGLMQMIPPTARKVAKGLGYPEFRSSMLLNPELNITFGAKYLKRLSKTMANNLPLVIASYNAGPHRVQGWMRDFGDLDMDEFIEHIPYMETRNYVKKVLRNYFVYQTLYEKRPVPVKWLAEKPTIKFTGPKPTSESWDD